MTFEETTVGLLDGETISIGNILPRQREDGKAAMSVSLYHASAKGRMTMFVHDTLQTKVAEWQVINFHCPPWWAFWNRKKKCSVTFQRAKK